MNRPLVRAAAALLAIATGTAVVAVTVVGLVGLVAGVVLTEPWSQGRIVSASLATTGAALLLVAHVLDPHALRRALDRSLWVASSLVEIVTSAGQR